MPAFVLFGHSKTAAGRHPSANNPFSARWLVLVLVAWVLAGVSMTAQYVSTRLPDTRANQVAFVFCFSVTAALILLPAIARHGRQWFRRVEAVGGVANGIVLAAVGVLTLTALKRVPPGIVFPFTVAGPVVLVLLLGQVIYQERLDRAAWLACTLGVFGLVALAVAL